MSQSSRSQRTTGIYHRVFSFTINSFSLNKTFCFFFSYSFFKWIRDIDRYLGRSRVIGSYRILLKLTDSCRNDSQSRRSECDRISDHVRWSEVSENSDRIPSDEIPTRSSSNPTYSDSIPPQIWSEQTGIFDRKLRPGKSSRKSSQDDDYDHRERPFTIVYNDVYDPLRS